MSDEIGKSDKADLIGEGASASPSKTDGAAARKKERLAAALRDNLKRRKAQMRGRRAMGEDEDGGNS